MPAGPAETKVDPSAAHLQTFFATPALRFDIFDLSHVLASHLFTPVRPAASSAL